MANGLVTASQFQLTPDIAGSAGRGLQLGEQIRQVRQRPEIEDLRRRALAGDVQASQELAAISPESAQNVQGFQANVFANLGARDKALVSSVAVGALQAQQIPTVEGKIQSLKNRRAGLISSGLPTTQTDEVIGLFETGRVDEANALIDQMVQIGQATGILKAPGAELTAGQREFTSLTKELSEADILKARRIELGLDPRAVGSADITAQQQQIVDELAETKRKLAEATQTGKLSANFKYKPIIQKKIKLAEAQAAERGEVLTDLARMEATLPELQEVTTQLKRLAPLATHTVAGKGFDTLSRELGLGATKGATARAKFISIIDNQVLPLLKPTFGAAFTVMEGDALRATMGDPDLSPEEKMAQLEAFIEQKQRNIRGKKRQLGESTDQIDGSSKKIGRFTIEVSE